MSPEAVYSIHCVHYAVSNVLVTLVIVTNLISTTEPQL